jgi:hypothetical protein
MQGEVDGMPLDRFHVGEMYEVGTTLASYLLATGAAVPILDERLARGIPLDLPQRPVKAADGTHPKRKTNPKGNR